MRLVKVEHSRYYCVHFGAGYRLFLFSYFARKTRPRCIGCGASCFGCVPFSFFYCLKAGYSDFKYLTKNFAMEDEAAQNIVSLVGRFEVNSSVVDVIRDTASKLGISLSSKQQEAVDMVFRNNLSMITGSSGTGKTTILNVLIPVYRKMHRDAKILLAAHTGKASRRMAGSTGCTDAKTLHSLLRLGLESKEGIYRRNEITTADLLVVDEFTLADMWLSPYCFRALRPVRGFCW